MALTTDQKASFLFKQSLGVAETSTIRDFFEESIKGRIFVLNNQIWVQSSQIPTTAPVLADGAISGVVQYFQARTMTAVAGVTNSFYLADLVDSIPFNFGDGSYNYTITNSSGQAIPFGQGDWLVNNSAGTLTFYGSVPSGMPPKISFYKYIGTKGAGGEASLPAVFVVATIAERDALTAKQGDLCVVTGTNQTFAYSTSTWVLLQSTGAVSSVNGQTGAVVLNATSVNAIPTSDKGIANGVASLGADGLVPASQLPSVTAGVASVNGMTGVVTLNAGDVGALSANTGGEVQGAVVLSWYNDGSGAQQNPTLKFKTTNGYSVGFTAVTNISALSDIIWTLPSVDGNANQVLATNGSGILSWINPSATTGTLVHPTANSTFEYGAANPTMSGGSNTAIGVNAGASITSGINNTAFGAYAGQNISSALNNVLIGRYVGNSITTGNSNVIIGASDHSSLTTSGNNILIGVTAAPGLESPNASGNIVIGVNSANKLRGNYNNLILGNGAGFWYEGNYNTILNCNSGSSTLLYSGVVQIGQDNLGTQPPVATNNNQFILGTSNHKYILEGDFQKSLNLGPTGASAGNTNEIRFKELAANGNNYVGFKAPDNIASNRIWVLPEADGSANQVLKTDGSGNLGWVSTSSAGSITHPTLGSTFEFGANNASMTGQDNTAFGVSSLGVVTSGYQNTTYGRSAGSSLTNASENTFLGYESGKANQTGDRNTLIGWRAGVSINDAAAVNANDNTAVGYNTLANVTTGNKNIAIGMGAGGVVTTGSNNTFIGGTTNLATISGSVAIGVDSNGNISTTTTDNEFILGTSNHKYKMPGILSSALVLGPVGTSAGSGGVIRFRELAGNGSSSVGLKAADSMTSDVTFTLPTSDGSAGQVLKTDGSGNLGWVTPGATGSISHPTTESTYEFGTNNASMTGGSNTAIGVSAGPFITTGQRNTLFGGFCGRDITTGQSNVSMGYSAGASLSSGDYNVAIGTSCLNAVARGIRNTAIGHLSAGRLSDLSSYNTIVNSEVNSIFITLNGVVAIGMDSGGGFATATADNQFVLGTSTHKYRLPGIIETPLVIGPQGTSSGSGGVIRFRELAANGINYVSFKAPDAITSDVTWTLPATDGTNGQVLTTNGSGILTWTTSGGGGGGTSLTHPTTGSTFESGGYNVAMTGTDNTAIGVTSGDSISSGTSNTFFGAKAGTAFTSGSQNVAIGSNALLGATEKSNIVAIGFEAANGANIGHRTVCIGSQAGRFISNDCVAIGYNAGMSAGSFNNTLVGSEAGMILGSGNGNTFIGRSAGKDVTSGGSNTFIGNHSGSGCSTGIRNLVIASSSSQQASTNGCVAIGTDSGGFGSQYEYDNDFVLGTSSHKYVFRGVTRTSITCGPTGTSSGETGIIKFRELGVNGNQAVGFRAPDAITTDTTWTLPAADGTSGQVLVTNGSGGLSWTTIAGSGTFPPTSAGDYDFLNSAYRRLYPKVNNLGNVSGTVNIDLATANYHRLGLTGNTTLNFQNVTTSTSLCAIWQVELTLTAVSTLSFQLNGVAKTINWDSGTAPTLDNGKLSILSFFSPNGTTSIYGNISILNAAP